jgi:hypothetical protein
MFRLPAFIARRAPAFRLRHFKVTIFLIVTIALSLVVIDASWFKPTFGMIADNVMFASRDGEECGVKDYSHGTWANRSVFTSHAQVEAAYGFMVSFPKA